MVFLRKLLRLLVPVAAVGVIAVAALTREHWLPLLLPEPAEADDKSAGEHGHADPERVRLSPTARANLGVVVRTLAPRTYWKAITVPGTVVDRPGATDRGVTAPLAGVVAEVHARPG